MHDGLPTVKQFYLPNGSSLKKKKKAQTVKIGNRSGSRDKLGKDMQLWNEWKLDWAKVVMVEEGFKRKMNSGKKVVFREAVPVIEAREKR